eukprot:CAMPEP_0175298120 /NCGR_PEP_ID=MMETSP0093-20121207/59922_1 /TAXON_ID=311494 /ORGANISM="Alexandrium monilatum, Strain CCMP3105" /LENGTH=212 /DNA_ID=CAMNT_0016594221 /DNA_START=461 /DNA_END=1100 /DNA_ORIENTATION=-
MLHAVPLHLALIQAGAAAGAVAGAPVQPTRPLELFRGSVRTKLHALGRHLADMLLKEVLKRCNGRLLANVCKVSDEVIARDRCDVALEAVGDERPLRSNETLESVDDEPLDPRAMTLTRHDLPELLRNHDVVAVLHPVDQRLREAVHRLQRQLHLQQQVQGDLERQGLARSVKSVSAHSTTSTHLSLWESDPSRSHMARSALLRASGSSMFL